MFDKIHEHLETILDNIEIEKKDNHEDSHGLVPSEYEFFKTVFRYETDYNICLYRHVLTTSRDFC